MFTLLDVHLFLKYVSHMTCTETVPGLRFISDFPLAKCFEIANLLISLLCTLMSVAPPLPCPDPLQHLWLCTECLWIGKNLRVLLEYCLDSDDFHCKQSAHYFLSSLPRDIRLEHVHSLKYIVYTLHNILYGLRQITISHIVVRFGTFEAWISWAQKKKLPLDGQQVHQNRLHVYKATHTCEPHYARVSTSNALNKTHIN